MRRSNTSSIKDIIKESINKDKLNDGLDKVKVLKLWQETAGKYAANATTNIYISDSRLYVSVNSSIIRNELLLIKSELRNRINIELGKTFINEIIIR